MWGCFHILFSVQFSSVAQLCPTLCDPMNCSTPGLPVHHQLPEFTQTQVHRVGDAIQPSHPVIPFSSWPQSLPASESFSMSQLFTWGGQSTGVSALSVLMVGKRKSTMILYEINTNNVKCFPWSLNYLLILVYIINMHNLCACSVKSDYLQLHGL